MINFTGKKNNDSNKKLALGIFIGSAATLLLSSKKVRSKLIKGRTPKKKGALKSLESGVKDSAHKVKDKITESNKQVSDKK